MPIRKLSQPKLDTASKQVQARIALAKMPSDPSEPTL
jgi:hypothetical protein